MRNSIELIPLREDLLDIVKEFTDRWIGDNYYELEELHEVLELSISEKKCASFCAFSGDELVGVRLSFAPGSWIESVGKGLTTDLWKVRPEKVGYFKSLFISEGWQKKGIGRSLSNKSLEVLKEMGAEGVLCHSWMESPENSSQIYLKKMGFDLVEVHPNFWYDVDYICPRCGEGQRCVCTGAEMMLYL